MHRFICLMALIIVPLGASAYEYTADAFEIHGTTAASRLNGDSAALFGRTLRSTRGGTEQARTVGQNRRTSVETHDALVDFLTDMAMEEAAANVTKDGVFSAGANWPTAWTRDMSYAIDLSLAFLFPEATERSLAGRVEDGMILQDTGSGGSYPVSTDRVIWGTAAYGYALFKQDPAYSAWVYDVLRTTLEYDYHVCYDAQRRLFRGESSFLDWREQTYPRWMGPIYIADSFALGTNLVYLAALKRTAALAERAGNAEDAALWRGRADLLRAGIMETFWLSDDRYFAAYLISHVHPYLYRGYETLGESLSILEDAALREDWNSILSAVKPGSWGTSVVAPQLSNVPPYHNDAVWPFVQGYRGLAAKKAGDAFICEQEFAAMMYSAALFRTFKENYVASTGSPETQTNSDRQLWSVAAWLSYIYKVICGIQFTDAGIAVSPLVFDSFRNGISLKDFSWNGSVLNMEISGTGDTIVSFTVNGKAEAADFVIPYEKGKRYDVKIQLEKSAAYIASYDAAARPAPKVDAQAVSPLVPVASADIEKGSAFISWRQRNPGGYAVLKNGSRFKTTGEREITVKAGAAADFYSVLSTAHGMPLLPSNPVRIESAKNTVLLEAEDAEHTGGRTAEDENPERTLAAVASEIAGTLANGGAYLDSWGGTEGDFATFTFTAKKAGTYALDFRFKNGHGPVNTGEKCAVRALSVNGRLVRRIAFPQLGNWTSWDFTAPVVVRLEKGENTVTLSSDEFCRTQHRRLNEISIDLLRISRIK